MSHHSQTKESGRAVLSPAAEVYWQRIENDPGTYLVIEAEGTQVRLTQKEVEILFELFKRKPKYITNPFSKEFNEPQEDEVLNNG